MGQGGGFLYQVSYILVFLTFSRTENRNFIHWLVFFDGIGQIVLI